NNFDWLRDIFTVTLKANDTFYARYELSDKGSLWTAGHKLEEGSIATPWMPSESEVTTADYPKYIGQYTNYTQADSPNPQDYTWSLIRGNDGKQGPQGPQGADGTDAPTIFVKSYTYSAGCRAEIKLTGPNAFEQTVYNRGHNIWVLDTTTHKLKEFVNCDTFTTMSFNNNGISTTLADYLNSLTDSIVVIAASDADNVDQNFRNVLNKMGGNPELGTWGWRTGHVFIGMSKRSDGTWPLQPRQGYEVAIQKDGSAPEIGCTLSIGGIVANGAAGPKGADGKTQYIHIAYADTVSGSGFSQTDHTKAYIGMYQDFNAKDSQNPQDYRWSKWKGSDGRDGIPGKPGADGRTPYVHFAYADSSDGQKGFSLTQNGRKRYLGVLTNFIKEDSTNPADYTWNDTAGSISVGGRNLLNGSKGPFKPDRKPTDFDNYVYYENETSVYLEQGKQYIISAKTDGNFTDWHNPGSESDNITLWLFHLWKGIDIVSDSKTGTTGTQFIWNHPTGTYHLRVNTYHKEAIKSVWEVKIEEGTVKTDWTPSVDDVQKEIDTKADDVLTQAQLNRLNEMNSIIKAELAAKASLDVLDQWKQAYQDLVNSNAANRAQAEKNLADVSARVAKIENNFQDMSERWNFIDSYMTASNEGLVVGKTDNSSSMLFSPNGRISMFSAGHEVMYISQGVIHIENGIFSKTIQIGNYREEQDLINPDRNVIRYVGGA
ncbi:interleukin-like EMT inducer domain-containing protein, partial [Streptococcus thermophilus]